MNFSANGLERLELLQQHRRENDQFWTNERLKREALTHQQRQEIGQLPKLDLIAKVILMRHHTSQDMEFRVLSNERRQCIRDQHEQELLALTERQRRDETKVF